jgi:hypothetical protein
MNVLATGAGTFTIHMLATYIIQAHFTDLQKKKIAFGKKKNITIHLLAISVNLKKKK